MPAERLLPLLIPFLAALFFPVATLALKRAMDLTRDPWGTLALSNISVTFAFLPFFLWNPGGGGEADSVPAIAQAVWQPILAGGLFVLAQAAAYLSFRVGELTLAVPAQGTKVLMVAGLTVFLLGQRVAWNLWAAALLAAVAIALLQDRHDQGKATRRTLRTLALALLASAGFAAFDVLVQKWSPAWGGLRFAAWAFLAQGLLSLGLLALPGPRLRGYGRKAWGWLLLGAGIMALITLGLVLVISLWGQATLVNILFNSRCLTSVVVIWLAGRWFGNREAKAGRRAMLHRLAGSACMLAAVVLALL